MALAEQKFEDGGAWPHLLPGDHAGGRAGTRGNAIFLIGILLQGLAEYHQETHDPDVPESLAAGAGWLLRCWNEEAQGWPYTALVNGEPLFKAGSGSNLMVAGPIACSGVVNNQPRFIDTAEAALAAVVHSSSSGNGKAIAQQMNFTSNLLAILQQWYATHRSDKGADVLSGAGDDMARYLAKTTDAKEHSVRGPNQKIFLVRLRGGDGQQVTAPLAAVRKPFGAMGKRAATGSIQVGDSAGALVKQGEFSTDLIAEQGLITVRPESADRGQIWSLVLTAGGDLEIELKGVPPYLALTADAWPPAARSEPGK